jgi:hypothetical protein
MRSRRQGRLGENLSPARATGLSARARAKANRTLPHLPFWHRIAVFVFAHLGWDWDGPEALLAGLVIEWPPKWHDNDTSSARLSLSLPLAHVRNVGRIRTVSQIKCRHLQNQTLESHSVPITLSNDEGQESQILPFGSVGLRAASPASDDQLCATGGHSTTNSRNHKAVIRFGLCLM